jgi:biopolymer transport protein ExbB/TolQ
MDFTLALELVIVVAVVSTQLYFFHSTLDKINQLSTLFPEDILDSSSIQAPGSAAKSETLKTDEQQFSKPFNQILDSINKYLIKNKGATDFSIIKSIVERSIDSKENFVASNISLPLYIGLMGTFSGVIIGLTQIAFSGGVTDQNINSFIGGVVIAMVASFFGLLLTVLNNSRNFKNAKATCDERKNNFYNFLQAELLPHLGSSLYDALDRLKVNINDFNKKFEANINLFDSKFSGNINTLRDSVASLSETIGVVVANTETQKEFLLQLRKMGYNRMAEANIKVFNVLKEAGPIFIDFIEKQKQLNSTVENAAHSIEGIGSIFDRVKAFEESINRLGENINTKQFLGNEVLVRIDKNLNYLDTQFNLLKTHEIKSSEQIEDFFQNQYKRIQKLTDNIKRELEDALNFKLQDNPLSKLTFLESIDAQVREIHKGVERREEKEQGINFLKQRMLQEHEKSGLVARDNKIDQDTSDFNNQDGRKNANSATKESSFDQEDESLSPKEAQGKTKINGRKDQFKFFNRLATLFSKARGRKA